MNVFSRPLTISLSPNTESDDVILALETLLTPWTWRQEQWIRDVEQKLMTTLGADSLLTYNSGRTAFYELLRAFDIGKGDEVIVQAFTCVAVPNSVLWTGARPIFADIDDTYNLNSSSVEAAITKKTKAIVVQHTFGIPANLEKLAVLAKKRGILLIEDCAHSLGATYQGRTLGSWGDAAFYSFGRDKILSSVFGGAATIAAKHKDAQEQLQKNYSVLPHSSSQWLFQQLFHPLAFSVILPTYDIGVGKVLLVLLQKLSLLSFPVFPEEKKGKQPFVFPQRYEGALARLLLLQLQKLARYRKTRSEAVKFYHNNLKVIGTTLPPLTGETSWLRFPLLREDASIVLKKAREQHVLLGNWYHTVIDPQGVDMDAIGYQPGSCPRAELVAKQIVNLPTLIPVRQCERVVSLLTL